MFGSPASALYALTLAPWDPEIYTGVPFNNGVASPLYITSYKVLTYCNDKLPLPSVCIKENSPLSNDGYLNPLAVNEEVIFKLPDINTFVVMH